MFLPLQVCLNHLLNTGSGSHLHSGFASERRVRWSMESVKAKGSKHMLVYLQGVIPAGEEVRGSQERVLQYVTFAFLWLCFFVYSWFLFTLLCCHLLSKHEVFVLCRDLTMNVNSCWTVFAWWNYIKTSQICKSWNCQN